MFEPKKTQSLLKVAAVAMIVMYILVGIYEFDSISALVDGYHLTSTEGVGGWLGIMTTYGIFAIVIYAICTAIYIYLGNHKK